ncbi:MAG: TetR/AcrR family transcriptional regulator [Reyranella sp.]|jgi:AcrR family transcriptional regulator|nr:MAG: TetR/AcrR family transcriptional regulator [Reyranella sp.]
MDGQALQSKPNLPTGRVDRVARTREAIVASALALATAGQVAPIVRDIAQMAGVSARTVFQHFADTAELYVAVLGRVLAALVGEAPELAASGPVEERVAALINKCADRYEQLRPMWTFVETLQRRSPEAADMVSQVYSANSANLAQAFAPELGALPPESRQRALTALALAIAPESWVVLRQRLGLSVDQARDELGFVVKSVFATAVARR